MGDLFALQADHPGQRRTGHEGGDAQKQHGKRDGELDQLPDLVGDLLAGDMAAAVVRHLPAIGQQQAVERSHHRLGIGTRSDVDDHAVEGPGQVEGAGQLALVHPEHPETLGVRDHLPRLQLIDEFRRQAYPDDMQALARAIDHRLHAVTRAKTVGSGKRLADDHLVAIADIGQAPLT
nr:hypothetical protein [Pseudomonas sp. BAY1663]